MSRSLYGISTLVISSVLLFACGEKKQQAPNPANTPTPVNLYGVRAQVPLFYDKYPGTVVSLMQVDIRAVTEGYITGIFFKEGDKVKKGQKLYTIDDSKYQASYNQAKAGVRVAESNLDQAQKDADRYTYLNEHDAVAKQTLDHAVTTLQNAKNSVADAKQALVKAQTDLNYSVIRAPFDGTIGISQVKLGNTVTPNQTILNTISSDGPTYIDFVVNEKQIPRFIKLQQEKMDVRDSIFTLLLPDNTLYSQPGQISLIDRGVNPQTGTIVVRLTFPNAATVLRAGMSCTVRVRNTDNTPQIMIPGKAVVEQMGEYFVYLAKDTLIVTDSAKHKEDKKDSKDAQPQGPTLHAMQKKIMQGQVVGDRVIILGGLKEGDSIVVDGLQKLHDGSLITTANPASQQAKPAGH